MARPNVSTSASSRLMRPRNDNLCHMTSFPSRRVPLPIWSSVDRLMKPTPISPELHGGLVTGAHAMQCESDDGEADAMRILIVDDHPIVASGCRTVVADEPDVV